MTVDIKYNIESVDKKRISFEKYTIDIMGWALTGNGKTPSIFIHLMHSEEIEYKVQYFERADVASKLNICSPLYCGFHTSFDTKINCKKLQIIFLDNFNKAQTNVTVQLNNKPVYAEFIQITKNTFFLLKHEGVFGSISKIYHKFFNILHKALIKHDIHYISNFDIEEDYLSETIANSKQNKNYVHLLRGQPLTDKPVKLICFYLPQFHAIPENDAWWGDGFTEWTYVKAAQPQFEGHYQPHIPADLGYYSLLDKNVQKKQIDLAKIYGIEGFCFYFYWFNGKRLLERPIENYLNNHDLDLPFCLCWANENWTRRWDGLEREILISQRHSHEDDIDFIAYVSKYFLDPRYIRIKGKPLLIVYRPNLLPDAQNTAACWRKWCLDNDVGEIYLAYTQAFENVSPDKYGFDAAIEFPPSRSSPPDVSKYIKPFNKNFKCKVYDWRVFINRSQNYKTPNYTLYRGVCPSWDNTPRLKNKSTVFVLNSPEGYKQWLQNAISDTVNRFGNKDERLIFVNAWNEWAEGAYLEPDRRYGYAYLNATYQALIDFKNKHNDRSIIFVCHDAFFAGAQLLSLYIVKMLTKHFKFTVHLILMAGGELEYEFRKYAEVYNLEKHDTQDIEIVSLINSLKEKGISKAICNSVISGNIIEILNNHGITTVALIHELPGIIRQYDAEDRAKAVAEFADSIVFPANYVKERFNEVVQVSNDKCIIMPQGLYHSNTFKERREEARKLLREKLCLAEDSKIVLTVGYGDHRKGVDIFVDVARKTITHDQNVFFLWVGNINERIKSEIILELNKFNFKNNIIFLPAQKVIDFYYAGSDLYLLSSREDPYPSVILEAMNVGLPTVAFADAGGFKDIVSDQTGALIPYLDLQKMHEAVYKIIINETLSAVLGSNAKRFIEERKSFFDYNYNLLSLLNYSFHKVSVIIPNYNYAQYIVKRINSIVNQTYPIYEIIILDDCSTDNSNEECCNCIKDLGCENIIVIRNTENSGNTFKQWQKGIALARGDYIWIAEADDLCENTFLEEAMQGFTYENVVLSYTQSKQIDENGKIIADDYIDYTNDVDQEKWNHNFINKGIKEIKDSLAIKNTIPNISAAVFKKEGALNLIESILEKNVAGDWLFYVLLLNKGNICFNAKSLNLHRRHGKSVTKKMQASNHFSEIVDMQEYIYKHYEISPVVRNKAVQYREKVAKYLGVGQ